MCEPVDPVDMIRRIPFLVSSMVEVCTDKGSHEREVAVAVGRTIRDEVDHYVKLIEKEREKYREEVDRA